MNRRQGKEQSRPAPERWHIWGLEEAYKDRGPIDYIVDGLIEPQSLSIFYGAPGSMKSMLMADLAVCVAGGKTWLPSLSQDEEDSVAKETKQSPVLICDFDNGERTAHDRIGALARQRGLKRNAPLQYVTVGQPTLRANLESHMETLAERVKAIGAKLVILDNLRDVSGGAKENDAEMGEIMANLRELTGKAETAVIIIHHRRKGGAGRSRSGDALRGHSSIEAALDLAMEVVRESEKPFIKVIATKIRGVPVDDFAAKFHFKQKGHTGQLWTAWFEGVKLETTDVKTVIQEAILKVVKETPDLNKGQITTRVKEVLPHIGRNRIGNHLDWLVTDEKIDRRPGRGREKLHRMPDHED